MKLRAFQKRLCDNAIDVAIFMSMDGDNVSANFFYFSGYSGWGFLAVPAKGSPLLVVPKMEHERAKATSKVRVIATGGKFIQTFKKHISSHKKVGIDKTAISLQAFSRLRKEIPGRYVDVAGWCTELRVTKTEEEISAIRKACKITDAIFSKMFFHFKQFKTESDVATFMTHEALKRGAELAYKPIVASGKHSCEPHHETSDSRLRKGFCLIDFGVRYKRYCSDVTRMVYIGRPSAKELSHYQLVLSAQEAAYAKAHIGVACNILSESAGGVLGKHKKDMIHSLGHGLGLDIHEAPKVRFKSKDVLQDQTVFTIEPGVYFPLKYGIRIEDDVLMTKRGPTTLTKTGKHLLIIPRS